MQVFFIENLKAIDSRYLTEMDNSINKMNETRSQLVSKVCELQKVFLNDVEKQNPKMVNLLMQQSLIDFQESYNRFINEQPALAQKKSSVESLTAKLDNLYHIFWDYLQLKYHSKAGRTTRSRRSRTSSTPAGSKTSRTTSTPTTSRSCSSKSTGF